MYEWTYLVYEWAHAGLSTRGLETVAKARGRAGCRAGVLFGWSRATEQGPNDAGRPVFFFLRAL